MAKGPSISNKNQADFMSNEEAMLRVRQMAAESTQTGDPLQAEIASLREEVRRLSGMVSNESLYTPSSTTNLNEQEMRVSFDMFCVEPEAELFLPYSESDLTPEEKTKFKQMWKASYFSEMQHAAGLVSQCIDREVFGRSYWQMRKSLQKLLDRLEENRLLGAFPPEFEKPASFNAYRSIFKEANERKLKKLSLFFRFMCGETLDNYEHLIHEDQQKDSSSHLWLIILIAVALIVMSFFKY